MSRRACKRCGRVKDTSEFPSVAGSPVCRACVEVTGEGATVGAETAPLPSTEVRQAPIAGRGNPAQEKALPDLQLEAPKAGGEPPPRGAEAGVDVPASVAVLHGDAHADSRETEPADPPAASRMAYERQRQRARTRLVQRHREEYLGLLAEERKGDDGV